mgnify:CR=1 FL=1
MKADKIEPLIEIGLDITPEVIFECFIEALTTDAEPPDINTHVHTFLLMTGLSILASVQDIRKTLKENNISDDTVFH